MYTEDQQAGASIAPNYLHAILRYKWYILVTGLPLLIVSVIIVASLPPVFLSEGTVMVETQKIPEQLVQTTVTTAVNEQIDIIKQRVMTRDQLLSVIRKYKYFNLDESSPIQVGQVVSSVRRSINIDVKQSRVGREISIIAFNVGFSSRNPAIAHAMASDLVTLFMSENIKVRTERASETTAFFRAEAAKVKADLDKTEEGVANFKQQNKDSLPEHLELYSDMRERARDRLDQINRNIRSAQEQIELLRSQLVLSAKSDPENLEAMRARYRELSLMYKPDYPDLIILKEQITLLEENLLNNVAGANSGSASEMAVRSKIKLIESEIDTYNQDRVDTEENISDLERRILNIPLVERGLIDLNRDYQAKLGQYNSLTGKIMEASMAESLEQGMQAEKFSILEPPILPRVPAAPNRLKLMIAGSVLSLGFPFGIALLLGHFDRTFRSLSSIKKVAKNYHMIEIPFVITEAENSGSKRRMRMSFVAAAIAFLIVALSLHFLYMPIDQIAEKLLARFGVFIF